MRQLKKLNTLAILQFLSNTLSLYMATDHQLSKITIAMNKPICHAIMCLNLLMGSQIGTKGIDLSKV